MAPQSLLYLGVGAGLRRFCGTMKQLYVLCSLCSLVVVCSILDVVSSKDGHLAHITLILPQEVHLSQKLLLVVLQNAHRDDRQIR